MRRPLTLAEVTGVTTAVSKPLWAAMAALAAVGAILVLALTNGSQSRGSLLAALQRPALLPVVSVGPGAVDHVIRSGPWTISLRRSPNTASLRNRVAVGITENGRPLDGAAVTASYSMPSMDMWNGLRTELAPSGPGGYAVTEPVLGMPGVWQLRIAIAPRGARALTVVVNDRMNP